LLLLITLVQLRQKQQVLRLIQIKILHQQLIIQVPLLKEQQVNQRVEVLPQLGQQVEIQLRVETLLQFIVLPQHLTLVKQLLQHIQRIGTQVEQQHL
jgi:hypothetical protein